MKYRYVLGKHLLDGEFGCKKCQYYIPDRYSCKLDECIHGDKNKYIPPKKEVHPCEFCKWGSYTGLSYVCMLPRCIPGLGKAKKMKME